MGRPWGGSGAVLGGHGSLWVVLSSTRWAEHHQKVERAHTRTHFSRSEKKNGGRNPSGSYEAAGGGKGKPRPPQDLPKTTPRGPKTTPRPPRSPQDRSKRTQDCPKKRQNQPKRPQDHPKRPRDCPKTAPRGPKAAQRRIYRERVRRYVYIYV